MDGMNNNDDLMLQYLLQTGAAQPGREALTRKQKQIELMRKMTPSTQGEYTQAAGGQPPIYVRPNALANAANIGMQAYTGYQQGKTDNEATQFGVDQNARLQQMIEHMRRKKETDYGNQGDVMPYGPGSGWGQA